MKKYIRFALYVVFVLLTNSIFAQRFWLTTYEFPYGAKTSITGVQDSLLFVGLTNGIIKSRDEGNSWQKVLNSKIIFSLEANNQGVVLAGGIGKIYFSHNFGQTWDSTALKHDYPITKILHYQGDEFFAITGNYEGEGVFYSDNKGVTWQTRNIGLTPQAGCDQIVKDKNGRLYLTIKDEESSGKGGLYVSDNKGNTWTKIQILINGENVIENKIEIEATFALSISPQDSLYMSIIGSAGSAGVRLNLVKSIGDINKSNNWRRMTVFHSSMWWYEKAIHNIHFAKNGFWYSSNSGSPTSSGTYFSKNLGVSWELHQEGLGYNIASTYDRQSFYENSSGKIWMVQYLDERVYWTDLSIITSDDDDFAESSLVLYPNPSKSNGLIKLKLGDSSHQKTISIFDLQGKLITQKSTLFSEIELLTPSYAGLYIVQVEEKEHKQYLKLIVN
jgi:hypothetical protein